MNRTRSLCLCGLLFFSGHALAQAPVDQDIGVVEKKTSVASDAEVKDWYYTYPSLKDLLAVIERPSLKLLASGETDDFVYAIARHENDLYIVCAPRHGGEIMGNGYSFSDVVGGLPGLPDGLPQGPNPRHDLVTLVQTYVSGPRSNATSGCIQIICKHDLQADRISIPPTYHGSFNLRLKVSNDKFDDATASPHVVWN